MNKKTFFGGAVCGALITLTIAAASSRPAAWEYSVQLRDLGYNTSNDTYYTKALNEAASDGWEVLCTRRVDFRNVEIVLRRAK